VSSNAGRVGADGNRNAGLELVQGDSIRGLIRKKVSSEVCSDDVMMERHPPPEKVRMFLCGPHSFGP
jgi:hypothetical protein